MSSPPTNMSYIPPSFANFRRMEEIASLDAVFQGLPSGQDAQINMTIGIFDYYGNIAATK